MNLLRKKLENGESVIGTNSHLNCKGAVEIIAASGFDFVFLDAEHHTAYPEDIYDLVKICKYSGCTALVRLPTLDLTYTKKVLDMGAEAVLFSMIKNAEDAKNAMDMCLYPPYGKRGFGPMSAVRWGLDGEKEYVDNCITDTVRMIQLEQVSAAKDLKNIVKNEYIDAYLFGLNDFAASMGHIMDVYNAEVQKEIKTAINILNDNNKAFGVITGRVEKDEMNYWKDLGARVFSLGADFIYLREGVKTAFQTMKREIKSK